MGNYKYYNYENLSIVSSRKPFNTHLWWEHATYGLILVDSVDQEKLYISTNKCKSWSEIDLSDNANSYKIQAGWLDGNDLWLVMCDNPGNNFEVCFVELDDSNDCNPVAVSTGADANTVYVGDIFKLGSDFFVIDIEYRSSTRYHVMWKVTISPLTIEYTVSYGATGTRFGYGLVATFELNDYYWFTFDALADNQVYIFYFRPGYGMSNESSPPGLADYLIVDDQNLCGLIHVEDDLFYGVFKKKSDSLNYLIRLIDIGPGVGSMEVVGKRDIGIMLDRNTPSGSIQKGFHVSEYKVYELNSNSMSLFNYISHVLSDAIIIGITDNFLINNDGDIFEYKDVISFILDGRLYHSRNDYPHLEMKFNSSNVIIDPQMFVRIIGPYTVDGSTTSDQVIFEGIAKKPTKGRTQFVLIENQGSEMDQVQPRGSKSGRTDEIIVDINNDGAPNGPEYIRDGILSAGGAMGNLELEGAKDYREVVNDFAEHDAFLWNLRPQGTLDYNNGSIDSGADIRFDGSTYTDVILQLKSWIIAKLNQIIVNGSINTATGLLYTGKWDDEDDQLENGINSVTIEDAQLNTNALCQAKADAMGGNESERTRARFKFRKVSYGFIQPGQTITFKYDITNYITIDEAQFIVDKMIMNIKSEIGFIEISSSL